MARGWFHLVMAVALLVGAARAGASPEEERAFNAARMAFQDELWQRAAHEFQEFTIRHPLSPRVPQAVLFEARSLLNLGDAAGAVTLLERSQPQAGRLADEYLLWMAEARFLQGDYTAAAATFDRLLAEHPGSGRALEAQVGQGAALGRLKQWPEAVSLLRRAEAPLARAMEGAVASTLAARGQLLLAEALLAGGDTAGAEATASAPQLKDLDAVLAWQRQELLARIWLTAGQAPRALSAVTNLLALANSTAQPVLRAESVLLQGRVFEQLGEFEAAVAAYRQNLNTNVPPAVQRQTVLRLADLLIAKGRLEEARATVELFLTLEPEAAGVQLAHVTLGELKLRQHLRQQADRLTRPEAATAPLTNLLEQAAADFTQALRAATDPAVQARAHLNLGWVQWMADDIPASAASFARAVEATDDARTEVVARFKWADALYRLGEFDGARTNYLRVVAEAPAWGSLAELEEPARYQALRAALEAGDAGAAAEMLRHLLQRFPDGFYVGSSVLLAGEGLERQGQPQAARQVFEQFLGAHPATPLAGEIRLAIARTYEAEQLWAEAIREYEAAAEPPAEETLAARAHYFRALATALSGDGAAALVAFTNFVARFPTNSLAPRGQWWLAEHYWQKGDYERAELNYQLLFGNWPASALAYEARMMAGRAAMARVSFPDAINYFTNLTSDLACPPALKAQALFAYGDALMRWKPADTNTPYAHYELAIGVFRDIERLYPSNGLAARAAGLIGNCHLTVAASDPARYPSASNAFQRALNTPGSGVATRSEAEFGLATVLEKLAAGRTDDSRTNLLQAALNHHLNILYGTNLRESERADPFWTRKAGLEAGRVAELLQNWNEARNIYETLLNLLPPLRPLLENKILKAQELAARAKT